MNPILDILSSDKSLTAKCDQLERLMLEEKQVDCPVRHSFGPGIYVREVFMPADTFAIGHHQNFEHFNIFLKGVVTVIKDDGTKETLRAPMMFTGQPGRKIGYIHEDVVWLNVYSTELTDIEALEAKFLTKSDTFTMNQAQELAMKQIQHQADRDDFHRAVAELGFTLEQVKEMSENTDDLIELPPGTYKIKLGDSPIHGKGLFATGAFETDEVICLAKVRDFRTIGGRYTNHSVEPNAKMVDNFGNIDLVATRPISGQKAGQDGDEIVIDYRQSVELIRKQRGSQCQV